jgi:antitoxin (DNA-binding transcriptional repressor) of toxin-antitoxin stability system
MKLSKSQFKPRSLEIMRQIEQTGETVIITDHGVPTLEIKPYQSRTRNPLDTLRGSLVSYTEPTLPVADNEWSATE